MVAVSSVARAPAGNAKVAGSMLESGISLLCPLEKHFALYLPLGPSSLPVAVTQAYERLKIEPIQGCTSCAGVDSRHTQHVWRWFIRQKTFA